MSATGVSGGEDMEQTVDFIVVGSGGGSMCAGLVLRQAGKSVLILEKATVVGGTTAKSGGVMWIPNNRFMAAAGIEDSFDKAAAYLAATVGEHEDAPGATRVRQHAYLRAAPQMVDFLVEQGIRLTRVDRWPDYYDERSGGVEHGRTVVAELFDAGELGDWREKLQPNLFQVAAPLQEALTFPLIKVSWRARRLLLKMILRTLTARLTGKHWVTAGAALQGRMLQAALKAGIEIRTNSPVDQLIVENGAVVGVITVHDGRKHQVRARLGVLLNAGGFAHNQAMRDHYIPHTSSRWTLAAAGDTGDMHREAMRIGAAVAQMDEMVGNQMSLPPDCAEPSAIQMQLSKPHAFLVDQRGARYMNECGSYMEFCQRVIAQHEQTGAAIPSWMIMDSRYLRTYMLASSMPGENKPPAWSNRSYLRKGETIEALAAACVIDPASLKATTERFNGFARAGHDEDFGRGARAYDRWLGDYTHGPNPTLGTVELGPFYAVPIVPGDVGTYGGVVTDEYARVLREDGSAIPGLYATGTTTASVMGHAYPGAGCSIGPSFTWGFVAARHVLGMSQTG